MTPERQRVILFGDSVILAGLQASLGFSSDLEVIPLDPFQVYAEDLRRLQPDAVIFELGSISADFFQSVLQQANLLLIGIDPETNRAMFWSGQEADRLSSEVLAHAIQHNGKTGPLLEVKRGKGRDEDLGRKKGP
jgi:hypothetical protein